MTLRALFRWLCHPLHKNDTFIAKIVYYSRLFTSYGPHNYLLPNCKQGSKCPVDKSYVSTTATIDSFNRNISLFGKRVIIRSVRGMRNGGRVELKVDRPVAGLLLAMDMPAKIILELGIRQRAVDAQRRDEDEAQVEAVSDEQASSGDSCHNFKAARSSDSSSDEDVDNDVGSPFTESPKSRRLATKR